MRSLRRLSAVSVASLPAILLLSFVGARAQSTPAMPFAPAPLASAPFAQPQPSASASRWAIHVSPPFAIQSPAPQQSQPSTTYRLPPISSATTQKLFRTWNAQKLALLARNEGPCYALRTYGFTTPRDTASAPQMSSYKTCTPASQAHLKELVKIPQPAK